MRKRSEKPLLALVETDGMDDILAERALDDMVRWLDDVRDIHEQAHAHAARDLDTMQNLQFLIDDVLREATEFLFELRCKQLGI
jgi:hypothetical protein